MVCVVLYVPGTGMVSTVVIKPNTCDYCCCFAATAAGSVDGAWYWYCSILTAADAAPGARTAALYCGSATKIVTLCLMRLSYNKGSILLGTGYIIYQKPKRKIFTAYVLN